MPEKSAFEINKNRNANIAAYTALERAEAFLRNALAFAVSADKPDCELIGRINTSLQFCQAARHHCEDEGYVGGNIGEVAERKRREIEAKKLALEVSVDPKKLNEYIEQNAEATADLKKARADAESRMKNPSDSAIIDGEVTEL